MSQLSSLNWWSSVVNWSTGPNWLLIGPQRATTLSVATRSKGSKEEGLRRRGEG